jgi:hypothetical protein
MKAIRQDDLGVLLGRLNGREPLAGPTTRAMVDRWRRWELVEPKKVMADQPRIVSQRHPGRPGEGQRRARLRRSEGRPDDGPGDSGPTRLRSGTTRRS